MPRARVAILHIIVAFMVSSIARLSAEDRPARAADHAAPIGEAPWLRRLGEHQGELTNGRFNVVFIGDSLTDFWTHTGKAVWDSELVPLRCMNCGIAGDRTEHILHRINRLDFRRASPKAFVLLMGTNNLGMEHPDKPQDVVRAIILAAQTLSKRHPQAKILVLEIPPSGYEPRSALRQSIKKTNALLAASTFPPQATWVPLYDLFVDETDQWKPGLTLDGTHFSAAGYAVLARLLAPRLKEITISK